MIAVVYTPPSFLQTISVFSICVMVGARCSLINFAFWQEFCASLVRLSLVSRPASMKQIKPSKHVLKKPVQAPQNTSKYTWASTCCGYTLTVKINHILKYLYVLSGKRLTW